MKMSTATMNQNMIDALKGVNTVMANVNQDMDISGIREVLKEFAKQSEKMEMQQEMMSDQIDLGMDTGDMVEQAEEVYSQILGEIGINLEGEMKAGTGALPSKQVQEQVSLDNVSKSPHILVTVETRRRPAS